MPTLKTADTGALYFSQRLQQKFRAVSAYPCTVVEAPMGYGKTTVVRELLGKKSVCVLWHNVYEQGTTDFWVGFCTLVETLNPQTAESLRNIGLPGDARLMREALGLLQGLDIPQETFFVIDDYHLIKSEEVDKFIGYLLRAMPMKLHLVITTRNAFLGNDPDLRLKRLVHQIALDDLQFTKDDIEEYYRLCGIKLTAGEHDEVYALTEGWVSALYLLMLNYIDTGALTASVDIAALIRQVVYEPLSVELKAFLHHVCMFEAFTAEQAAFMWTESDAGLLLDLLMRRNAFITKSKQSGEYRLHNIFFACIRSEFAQLADQRQKELWGRAGQWHVLKREYVAAMDCFYKAGDFEQLVEAFEKDRSYTTRGQYKEKMVQYLSACPLPIRKKHHYAFLIYARLLYLCNEQALFAACCRDLVADISADETLEQEERNTLLGEFQLVISFTKYNSIEGMGNHFLTADNLMKEPSCILDNTSNWTMGAPSVLYMFYREKGSLDKEITLMRWGLSYYHKLTAGHGLGVAEVFEAEALYMRGDFDDSDILLHRALLIADEAKQWSVLACAKFQQAKNLLFRGDYAGADSLLRDFYDSLKQNNRFVLLYTMDIIRAYLLALVGQPEKAAAWIGEVTPETAKILFTVVPALQLVQSRLLLEEKQYAKLIGLSEQFLKISGIFPYLLCHIYAHIHLAAAYLKLGKRETAQLSLKTALDLAMADRIYMPFVENGSYVGALLWDAALYPEYAGDIAVMGRRYGSYSGSVESIRRAFFGTPVSRLTEREEEVAMLAARGLANKDISKQLFVSENTVKAHLKSAFEKLSIKSRAQLSGFYPG